MSKAKNMHRHSIRYNGIQDVAQRNISRKHAAFICHEKAILHASNAVYLSIESSLMMYFSF